MIEQMEENPKRGWTLADLETLARQEGLELRVPKRGSHYTLCSKLLRDILTVPHNRPIKVIYIKKAVSYVRAHRDAEKLKQEDAE